MADALIHHMTPSIFNLDHVHPDQVVTQEGPFRSTKGKFIDAKSNPEGGDQFIEGDQVQDQSDLSGAYYGVTESAGGKQTFGTTQGLSNKTGKKMNKSIVVKQSDYEQPYIEAPYTSTGKPIATN
mmetsp:Transcript_26023/g.39837  ORF Transcript_26023/g.39837 Transcript_26023/m.39837 type:complete len:125 (-) Transcript_26023:396-770(-)|eukprot:CAMPEP_0170512112 /NCGR_PEP_ID=MMETSP0208-20121228/66670_1 /TAXON_ID=197538 /ORGANISM="Strombidium inclinatum, Strain S3" /LENGTH=124 /DNA_ID=CAMNT_0010795709 /DNA_START=732 /DNA_END=1106 /DNA_ORIENTATION=+